MRWHKRADFLITWTAHDGRMNNTRTSHEHYINITYTLHATHINSAHIMLQNAHLSLCTENNRMYLENASTNIHIASYVPNKVGNTVFLSSSLPCACSLTCSLLEWNPALGRVFTQCQCHVPQETHSDRLFTGNSLESDFPIGNRWKSLTTHMGMAHSERIFQQTHHFNRSFRFKYTFFQWKWSNSQSRIRILIPKYSVPSWAPFLPTRIHELRVVHVGTHPDHPVPSFPDHSNAPRSIAENIGNISLIPITLIALHTLNPRVQHKHTHTHAHAHTSVGCIENIVRI